MAIHFAKISKFVDIGTFRGKQPAFKKWLSESIAKDSEDMMKEYIRLTNIAFSVVCESPPVFLLDEIQGLCKPTSVISKFQENQIINHSYLSLLLTQLAGKLKPVCICTGTNNGNIIRIPEIAKIMPKILPLSTFFREDDYNLFWEKMTVYRNSSPGQTVTIAGDEKLIESLVFASYQIPRLLYLAHDTWFRKRTAKSMENKESLLQHYEDVAKDYYSEMAGL